MEKTVKDYGRYLLLQAQLPGLEREKETARRQALAAGRERDVKQLVWKALEDPGFFQRLLGKVQEKRDEAYQASREAEAVWKEADRLSQWATSAHRKAKEELGTLAGAEEQYARLDKTQEVRELAREAFRPAAIQSLKNVLTHLEQAMQWELQEQNGRMNGMLDHLAQAREAAKLLRYILQQFPKPESWTCPYLEDPDSFIHDGVIMKVSSRDKTRAAIGQMQRLKERLNS